MLRYNFGHARPVIVGVYFLLLINLATCVRNVEEEKKPQFWKNLAKQELDVSIEAQKLNMNAAKNVIIFLGDGMGIPTITAARILKGQMRGESGEETKLAMDHFPHVGLSRTYSANKQVSDSAATATAYLCGVKSNYFTVGLSAAATLDDCQSSKGNEVDSVLEDFYNAGKSTGVVTTTRITHATPSAAYAHSASRKWYSDANLPDEAKTNKCKDIAQQFYDQSHKITVALGGGRKDFKPSGTTDVEYPDQGNKRQDGRDLIGEWKDKMTTAKKTHKYVWNKADFDAVDVQRTDALLGLFEPEDMQYEAHRNKSMEPSLADMTEKAIEMLRKNDKGYFLLVEGGRIDHAHHATNAYLSLHDAVAFDNAIAKAAEMTSQDDTMIIVTADHSHTFTMGGYADRGNDIFGLAPNNASPELAEDGKPYTTLAYANGAGYHGYYSLGPEGYYSPNLTVFNRRNLTGVDTASPTYLQQTAVPRGSETHGGEDVAIMATGPMAHLFHGVHEQMYIAYVMRYVACVGPDQGHCNGKSKVATVPFIGGQVTPDAASAAFIAVLVLLIICLLLLIVVSCLYIKSKGRAAHKNSVTKGEQQHPLNPA